MTNGPSRALVPLEKQELLGKIGCSSKENQAASMSKDKITDYDIQALVDGELGDSQCTELLEVVVSDPALYNRYLLYKRQKNLLKSWWKDN
jgi:hypothetical protein